MAVTDALCLRKILEITNWTLGLVDHSTLIISHFKLWPSIKLLIIQKGTHIYMALSSRFVFINGPSLVSIESREDRRWLRSRVIRRAYREHEKQKSRVARHERAKEQKFALDCVGNQLTSQAGLPGRRLLPARVIGTQDPACTTCYGSFHSSPREKTSSSTCSSYSIPTHISSIEFFASIDSRYNELIHYCKTPV